MVTSAETEPQSGGTLVLPYIKLVPAGVVADGTRLRLTAVITPELAKEGEASPLRLETWPENIRSLINGKNWKLNILMRKVPAELPCDGTGNSTLPLISELEGEEQIEATAFGLQDAYRNINDVEKLGRAWRKAIVGASNDGAQWAALAEMLGGSIQGDRFQPDREEMQSDNNLGYKEPEFGDDGQLKAPDRSANAKDRIFSLLSLPHSDLALFLGRQRAHEILEGLDEGVDPVPEARVARLLKGTQSTKEDADASDTLGDSLDAELKAIREMLTALIAELENLRRTENSSESELRDAQSKIDLAQTEMEKLRADYAQKVEGVAGLELGKAGEQRKKEKAARYRSLFDSESVKSSRKNARDAFKRALKDQKDRCSSKLTLPMRRDVSEDVTFDEAAAVYEYGTWEQRGDTDTQNAASADITKRMMQAYAAIQTNPVMARLFGLVIDLEVPLDALPSGQEAFVVLAASLRAELGTAERATPWTLTRLARRGNLPVDFWPADIAEIDASGDALVPMRAGRVVMGLGWQPGEAEHNPRYDLTSLDVRAATEMELQRRANMTAAAQDRTRESSGAAIADAAMRLAAQDAAQAHTLQTPGLTVLDRMSMPMAARKLAAAAAKFECNGASGECIEPATGDGASCCLLLEASDLVTGYRLEIGVPAKDNFARTEWRPLLSRIATYTDIDGSLDVEKLLERLIGDGSARMALESPSLGQMSRLLPYGSQTGNTLSGEAVVEEAGEFWDGGPMGVFCGQDPDGLRAVEILPYRRKLSLPKSGAVRPPKQRFGWAYRLLKPAVFAGGVSPLTPEELQAEDIETFKLAYPPKASNGTEYQPYQRFLRHSRLAAPQVVLPSRHAIADRGGLPYENGRRMIVRTVRDPWGKNGTSATDSALSGLATPDIAQRFLVVPSLAQDDAARHGVFDTNAADERPRGAMGEMRLHHRPSRFPVAQTTTTPGFDQVQYIQKREIIVPQGPSRNRQNTQRAQDPIMAYGSGTASTFYPDPAADYLVMALRHRESDRFFEGSLKLELDQAQYPDLTQVGLTLERIQGPRKKPVASIVDLQTHDILGMRAPLTKKRFDPDLNGDVFAGRCTRTRAWDVRLQLAAGEEFELDVWLAPSAQRLAREFAAIEAIATAPANDSSAAGGVSIEALKAHLMGFCPGSMAAEIDAALTDAAQESDGFIAPGGIIGPHPRRLMGIATLIHNWMMCRPLRELAAVTTLELVHAVNRPERAPIMSVPTLVGEQVSDENREEIFALRRELVLENQRIERSAAHAWRDAPVTPGSTGFALSGDVAMDLCDADVLELFGTIALPPGSVFDDPAKRRSLTKRRAGEWPTYVNSEGKTVLREAIDVFGFNVVPTNGFTSNEKSQHVFLRVEDLVARINDSDSKGQLAPCGTVRFDVAPFFADVKSVQGSTAEDDLRGKIIVGGVLTPSDGGEDIMVWVEGRTVNRLTLDDTKAREITVRTRAISRTAGLFDTVNRIASNGDLVQGQPLKPEWQTATGQVQELAIPSSERPAACDALTPHPVFRHTVDDLVSERALIRHQRKAWVRIRLERGWFSSGEGERIGVVLWPPMLTQKDMQDVEDNRIPLRRGRNGAGVLADLSMFTDEDLGIGGKYITRKGADPIRGGGREDRVFLGLHDFPHVHLGPRPPEDPWRPHYIPNVVMPVAKQPPGSPTSEASKNSEDTVNVPEETLTVGLLALKPRFDLEEEIWYADLLIEPELASDPFLRLGLVRYQAFADGGYEVSSPVQQWVQLLPERTLEIQQGADLGMLSVQLFGQSSTDAKQTGYGNDLSSSTFARPVVRVHLLRETDDGAIPVREALEIDPDSHGNARTLLVSGSVKNGVTYWRFNLPRPDPELGRHVLYIEEIDMRRPATYDTEPIALEELEADDPFVPSGPRYAAKLEINPLLTEGNGP